jgi:hypothetical protein
MIINLQSSSTAQAQAEKDTIRQQLAEITTFSAKIDELIVSIR